MAEDEGYKEPWRDRSPRGSRQRQVVLRIGRRKALAVVVVLVCVVLAIVGAIALLGGPDTESVSYEVGYEVGEQQGVYSGVTDPDAIELICSTNTTLAQDHGFAGRIDAAEVDADDFRAGCIAGYQAGAGA